MSFDIFKYLDKETFVPIESSFERENELFEKALKMKILCKKLKKCSKCPGMNICGITEVACGWGNLQADLFFLGQSLCTSCMGTQIPFTKGSGYYLDLAFRKAGAFRTQFFFSNVVHCHPSNNRASTREEKINCRYYLAEEIKIVQPKYIVALGVDAVYAAKDIRSIGCTTAEVIHVKHPASFMYNNRSGIVKWIDEIVDIIYERPRDVIGRNT